MRPSIAGALVLVGLALGSSGCLVNRRITDVISHETANSYKVQTEDAYFAFFSGWVEWSAWSCYQGKSTFHCSKIEHEERLAGRKTGPDALPPRAPAAPAPEPPAAPAPPAEAAPPTTSRVTAGDGSELALGERREPAAGPSAEVVR